MAREVIEKLIDDLDGSEATETVTFGLGGTSYEIDLNKKNVARLRNALEQYVKAAWRGRSTADRRKGSPSTTSRKAQGDYDIVLLREWAGSSNFDLPARSRTSKPSSASTRQPGALTTASKIAR